MRGVPPQTGELGPMATDLDAVDQQRIAGVAYELGIAAECERCAKLIEAEAARVLALQQPNAAPMSMDDTINLNLRMTTVLLPNLVEKIRNPKMDS